jgi:redox-sensitive bicupin YhaK (pirin superfamily)
MSAGTGIRHSEFNPSSSEIVHFLQIWIVPETRSVAPRYQQVHFADSDKRGRLRPIISPDGAQGSLSVYQDARVFAGLLDGRDAATLELPPQRYAYVHLARGSLEVNGVRMNEGDGARVREERQLRFSGGRSAEVLVFDLRPRELPQM